MQKQFFCADFARFLIIFANYFGRNYRSNHSGEVCASDVPLQSGDDALFVNWLSLTVTDGKTREQLYTNSWVTNHDLSPNCVVEIAEAA